MARSSTGLDVVRHLGAQPVGADALDRNTVIAAVESARPDVIVHQLTALPKKINPARFARDLSATNRLRTAGTDNLIAAAQRAGVRRVVAQSFAGWPYAREGSAVKSETDPLDSSPPAALRESLEAIEHLEQVVTQSPNVDGAALRYGFLYGPPDVGGMGAIVPDVRRRLVPIVGSGLGVWSFIHVEDVATATLAAIDAGARGIYNIVDDEPATVSEWLPELARIVGGRPPFHIPAWLGRLAVGEAGLVLMTTARGAANTKAKRELAWQPRWSTWRDGFREEFAGVATETARTRDSFAPRRAKIEMPSTRK
jgi:nucleoside-diphosphate-sugar epimerase